MLGRVVIAIGFAAACSAGTYTYLDNREAPAPAKSDAAAPSIVGATVGTTTTFELEKLVAKAGLHCEDVSLLAMMKKAHASAKGAPAAMPSDHMKMLSDPAFLQIRFACDDVPSANGSVGRLLFVHDSRFDPLKTVAHQRFHVDHAEAANDFATTIALLEKTYGKPSISQGDATLAAYEPVAREWNVRGARVKVSAMNLGKRGTQVTEEIDKS